MQLGKMGHSITHAIGQDCCRHGDEASGGLEGTVRQLELVLFRAGVSEVVRAIGLGLSPEVARSPPGASRSALGGV